MKKFNIWRKEGNWDIYETSDGLIIGEPQNGYLIFLNKKGEGDGGVHWDDKDLYFSFNLHEYVGTYKTKGDALKELKRMLGALHSDKVINIPVIDPNIPASMVTSTDTKKKGAIIFYPKGDIEALTHEQGHIEAGHTTSEGVSSRYGDEVSAVKYQVKILHDKGYWNNNMKQSVARNLASYSRKPYQKKRRALRDISKIEQSLGIIR